VCWTLRVKQRPIFFSGGEDLTGPPQTWLEIKAYWLFSLARMALGNYFGDWAYAQYRVMTFIVQG